MPWKWYPVMTPNGFCYIVSLKCQKTYIIIFQNSHEIVNYIPIYSDYQGTHNLNKDHNFSRISPLQVKLWYHIFSRITFTWDPEWTQTSLKSQTTLKSQSIYMAISLWPTLRLSPFKNCSIYMAISVQQLSKQ